MALRVINIKFCKECFIMKFMKKNKKGFTLVELMIVVVIMAILVAVAVPIYNAVTTNARRKTCAANARILSSQVNTILMNNVNTNADGSTAIAGTAGMTLQAATPAASIAAGASGSFVSYLQGSILPACPFDPANRYVVAGDGKVTCNAVGTHG